MDAGLRTHTHLGRGAVRVVTVDGGAARRGHLLPAEAVLGLHVIGVVAELLAEARAAAARDKPGGAAERGHEV